MYLFSLLDSFTYLYECTSVERELKGCKVDMKEVKKSGEGAGARKVGGATNRAMSPVRINRDELEKVRKIKILGHIYTFLSFPPRTGMCPKTLPCWLSSRRPRCWPGRCLLLSRWCQGEEAA